MKNEFYVIINTIDRIKEFVKIVGKIECDIDIIYGRYIIDARSIMGIFSLDLSKELMLRIHSTDERECDEIKAKLDSFLVR